MTEERKQELLEQAKRDYPVGTKFYPSHLGQRKDYCIVTEDTVFQWHLDHIAATIKEGLVFSYSTDNEYGNTVYNRYVCTIKNGHVRWAEILRDDHPYWDHHDDRTRTIFEKVFRETTLRPGDKHYGNNKDFELKSNANTREDIIEYIIDHGILPKYGVDSHETWFNLGNAKKVNIIGRASSSGGGSIYDESNAFPHAISEREVLEYKGRNSVNEQCSELEQDPMSLVKAHFQVGDKHFGYNDWVTNNLPTREALYEYLIQNSISPKFEVKNDEFYNSLEVLDQSNKVSIYCRNTIGNLYAYELPEHLRLAVTERELNHYKRNKLKAVRVGEHFRNNSIDHTPLIHTGNDKSKSRSWHQMMLEQQAEDRFRKYQLEYPLVPDQCFSNNLDVAKLKLKKRKKQRKLSKQ